MRASTEASPGRTPRRLFLTVAAGLFASACAGPVAPDLVITHAKVFTNDTARPWAEAVAIKGDRVVAVGDSATVAAMAGASTRVIDASGRVLVPGFNDARVDLPLEPPTPAGLSALDANALAHGVTSLQVVAGGPMRSLVVAAQQATRKARWRVIRSPMDTVTLSTSTSSPPASVAQDEEPYLPPQPGERLSASGVAWTAGHYPGGARRAVEAARIPTVVGWAYGAEDPLVMSGDDKTWLDTVAEVGLLEVWRRKRPRFDVLLGLNTDRAGEFARRGVMVLWAPVALSASGPGLSLPSVMPGLLVDAGATLALGSAGRPDPTEVLRAATVPSRTATGRALTREEAVRAMTWGSAYAEKGERDKGWLGAGTLADLAVLSDDVFTVPADRLAAITSVLTLVGGTIVYDAGVLPH